MKVVPGVNGKYGLSIRATKFDGSITGSYGAPPSRWQAASRASFCSWQVCRASLRSADAWLWHCARAAGSARLSHFPKASDLSLNAAAPTDINTLSPLDALRDRPL